MLNSAALASLAGAATNLADGLAEAGVGEGAASASDGFFLALLAVVQGLTEFLPISSSGHLVLSQHLFGLGHAPLALDAALHVGTLLSVVIVYRADLIELVTGLFRGRWQEPALIVLATVPVAAIGLLYEDAIESAFGDPRFAAGCLLGTAVILLLGEWGRRRSIGRPAGQAATRLTLGRALVVGLCQCLAILPGISRSGTTIAAGLLVGLEPRAAARFSFLLSIPAVGGAAVLKVPELLDGGAPNAPSPVALLGAVLLSAFVGWIALRFLLAFLGRGAFAWFSVYCAVVGGLCLVLL